MFALLEVKKENEDIFLSFNNFKSRLYTQWPPKILSFLSSSVPRESFSILSFIQLYSSSNTECTKGDSFYLVRVF